MSEAEDVAFKEMFPLVIGGLAGLAVFFIVIAKVISATVDETYVPPGKTVEEALSERLAPIGQVNMGGPMLARAESGDGSGAAAADSGEPMSGQEVYDNVCSACHASGVAGAPQTGNGDAWQSRIADGGYESLYQNALDGIGAMPPKGGGNISNEELERAIRYILEESGVSP